MTRTLAVGLGGDGIAVTAVAPGLTRTPASAGRAAAEFAPGASLAPGRVCNLNDWEKR